MAVSDAHVFPSFPTPVLTTFFPYPLTTFLTGLRGEMQKYAGKKVLPQPALNLQPLGHESDILTNEPPRWD